MLARKNDMKGLELSTRFFTEWGLPYIKAQYPALADRVAAGLCGGSDSIGADDGISRDHDWGPRFLLWLTSDDFSQFGEELSCRINATAPDQFLGFARPREAIRVLSVDPWFRKETGHAHPPERWTFDFITESHLYFIKHAPVFHDPLGEFTTRKNEFSLWPTEVFLDRVKKCCWCLWHFGEYNFCSRVSKRDDAIARHTCIASFVEWAMRLCFYLDNDFSLYWKWMSHQFTNTRVGRQIAGALEAIVATEDVGAKASHVQSICRTFREELYAKGLISDVSAWQLGSQEIAERRSRLIHEQGQQSGPRDGVPAARDP